MITEKQVFAALPRTGFLRSYVEWAASWIEASASFQVASALALLSQSVPTEINFPGVTRMRANLYTLLVGPSSASGKTRSIEAAKSVLEDAIPEAAMVTPGSPEACLEALNGKPQILFYDEFGDFLSGAQRGQMEPMKMRLTDVYDCGKVGRNIIGKGRKPKPPEPNPRLSILAGVAPDLLEDYTTPTEWNGGFLARFYTVQAKSEREVNRSDFDVGERDRLLLVEKLKQYKSSVDCFGSLTFQPCKGFTTGAILMWDEWRRTIRSRAAKGDYAIQAAIHRAQGHCLKIALLLAWDYGPGRTSAPWYIDVDVLETAITFTEWHISSVEEIAEELAPDIDMRHERRMYRAIVEEPTAYSEALKKAKLTKRRGDEMIASLLEKKMIVRVVDETDITAPVRYKRARVSNVIQFKRPTPPEDLF